jgi:hypothetical protein
MFQVHMSSIIKRSKALVSYLYFCSRSVQSALIQMGLVQHLFAMLHHHREDMLSEESFEYATALLMNLCLRSSGKRECATEPGEVLKPLIENMEHDNPQVNSIISLTIHVYCPFTFCDHILHYFMFRLEHMSTLSYTVYSTFMRFARKPKPLDCKTCCIIAKTTLMKHFGPKWIS